MRRTLWFCFGMLLLLGAAGCGGSSGPSIKTHYDAKVDFSRYKTFAFQSGRIILPNDVPDTNNTLIDDRIRNAVTAQLTAKGLQPESTSPDLIVTYVAGAKNKQEIEQRAVAPAPPPPGWIGPGWYYPGYYGRAGWWDPGSAEFFTRNYTEGTLIVDLLDPKAKQLVWRAYVTGEVNKVPDDKAINSLFAKIFSKFPPKPKQ